MAGTIYLVATPIGNLEDITLRALRVLREADLIACEDTRHTRKLLRHFQIRKPLVSYHEHNEPERAEQLVRRALEGSAVAVVSDAGTLGISDPGYRVVRRAIECGVRLVPVPGPAAIEAALAVSGLPAEAFHFGGFLPSKPSQRRKVLQSLAGETATLIFYEAPHRIVPALEDLRAVLGPRPVVLARELTKVHEEFLRGTADELLAILRERESIQGEITLLVGRGGLPEAGPPAGLRERVEQLMREENLDRMAALKRVARERGVSKREAYRQWEETDHGG